MNAACFGDEAGYGWQEKGWGGGLRLSKARKSVTALLLPASAEGVEQESKLRVPAPLAGLPPFIAIVWLVIAAAMLI